jgi:triosephosphate isomerase (TIM)
MTNKLKYFIGNWKMFGDFNSFKIISKINQYANSSKRLHNKKIVICVPNTLISTFSKKLKSKFVSLGAQNCHYYHENGPYTGSINSKMLKVIGTKYIILGHSENRAEGETNSMIKMKINSALQNNLNVIFCIGESFKEKKLGKTFLVLKKQIKQSLDKKFKLNKIILAYEPVWSIGTNKIPKSNELRKNVRFIKEEVRKIFKHQNTTKVLYGGSVNDKNISLFYSISDIDGFLIGRASQSAKKFIDIVKNYYK